MNRRPSVAVITATKNRLELLRAAMDSVQAQDYDAWEHIVVDDGSDDGTAEEVARRIGLEPRIRYFSRTGDKAGANTCRNLGIRESRAELLVFLDSDDLLSRHCLRQRVEALARNRDLDFAVFPGSVFTETPGDGGHLFSPMTLGSDLDRFLYLDHPWPISGPIWRRASLQEVGLFEEELLSWQDVELNIRALTSGLKYVKFSTPDHHIRWHSEATRTSVRQFQSADHLDGGMAIVLRFRSLLRSSGLMTWARRRALAGLVFLLAERWLKNGSLRNGLRTWLHAYRTGLAPLHLLCFGTFVLIVYRMRFFTPPYNERLLERFRCAVRFRE